MFEKVNPAHPDKIADRIAGAIVDKSYEKQNNPKVAVEVLIGHGECFIESETSVRLSENEVREIVDRIAGKGFEIHYRENKQDEHLSKNQSKGFRCGDNGIFKGTPVTSEQKSLTKTARAIYDKYPFDGKYIQDGKKLVVCQSNASSEEIQNLFSAEVVNPLGYWTGGVNVDTGATNRKLGSDMGDSVTGGGLHGKDLSKADVSINIYCWLKAQAIGEPFCLSCSIGDKTVDGVSYSKIVEIARDYIEGMGGFEKFAEWGLIR